MKHAPAVFLTSFAIALLSTAVPRASAQGDSAEHTKKGIELAKEKKYDQAAEEFGAAMKADPNDPKHYLNRGRAYRAAGKFDLAEKDFSKLIEMEPKSSNGYSERGKTKVSQKTPRLTGGAAMLTASPVTRIRRWPTTRKCSS